MEEKILKHVAEAPAEILEKAVDFSTGVGEAIKSDKGVKKVSDYWKNLGPGLTTGASDDDPSGIATYSQAGAGYGFSLLWMSLYTFPLMAVIQEMCARIGLVTGRGLAANIRLGYPKWVLMVCTVLLFFANTLNIGADIGAMAKSVQLLWPQGNFTFLILVIAGLSLGLQIFISYGSYAKYLKWLALLLLSYIVSALSINMDWHKILYSTVVPSITINKDSILLICAILGTTISPYLFFWQTSQEVEEQILEGKVTIKLRQSETTNEEIKAMRVDIWSGMFLSNLVMFFIIAACGATLYVSGVTTINTAADAAAALRPIAGDFSYLLFALGVIGTGMLAIPVLAGSASYALSESMGWKYGLYRKLKEASAFYGVIIISTLVGVGINFIGIDPIKALIYSAVANGVIAPPILILIVLISSNKKVMGNRVNNPVFNFLGWLIVVVMMIAGGATIFSLVS